MRALRARLAIAAAAIAAFAAPAPIRAGSPREEARRAQANSPARKRWVPFGFSQPRQGREISAPADSLPAAAAIAAFAAPTPIRAGSPRQEARRAQDSSPARKRWGRFGFSQPRQGREISAPADLLQDYPKTEIFGSAGWARWWDDEGASSRGIVAGGGIGRRVLPQFAVEGEAAAFRGTRDYPGPESPFRSHGALLTGNGLLYIFRSERTLPFLLLGAGVSHFTAEENFGSYRNARSRTGFIGSAGAGVKLFLTERVALRPEIRLTAGSAGSAYLKPFSFQVRFSMGVGYHW